MDFQYYNPSDEPRSCVVRTMTRLTGKDYQTVKKELTALAEETGFSGYNEQAVFESYMAAHGFSRCENVSGMQVKTLQLSSGMYCIFCTNRSDFYHLMPVIDGVIFDRRDDCQDLYVLAVYQKVGNSIEVK